MNREFYLQVGLAMLLSGSIWVTTYGEEPPPESFEILKVQFMEKIKKDKIVHGKDTKVFLSPFLKCMESEHPLKKGSFIDKMYHEEWLNMTCLSFMVEYVKDRKNPLPKQQKLVTFMLKDMSPHSALDPGIILDCFDALDYYNEESREVIKKYILKEGDRRALFLIDLAGLYDDPEVIDFLHKWAKQSSVDNFWETPGFALLILGRHGDKKAIEKIIEIAEELVTKKKKYMTPVRLAYVIQPEIVDLLREFLKSREFRYNGRDTVPQKADVSHSAARALSSMIIGYPKVDYWEYTEELRQECIEWFDKHKEYKFNDKFNFSLY